MPWSQGTATLTDLQTTPRLSWNAILFHKIRTTMFLVIGGIGGRGNRVARRERPPPVPGGRGEGGEGSPPRCSDRRSSMSLNTSSDGSRGRCPDRRNELAFPQAPGCKGATAASTDSAVPPLASSRSHTPTARRLHHSGSPRAGDAPVASRPKSQRPQLSADQRARSKQHFSIPPDTPQAKGAEWPRPHP